MFPNAKGIIINPKIFPQLRIRIFKYAVSYSFFLKVRSVQIRQLPRKLRSEGEFLYHILEEVIKAGDTTLNIPDTVGYTMPNEFGQLIADIKANTPGIENVIISIHCQNDPGLSTANTLAGACAGARQVEVTINGIGERAGNASFEESWKLHTLGLACLFASNKEKQNSIKDMKRMRTWGDVIICSLSGFTPISAIFMFIFHFPFN